MLTFSPLAFFCLSYLAPVFKVEFPEIYSKESNRRWTFESCAYLLYAFGGHVVVNLEMIRDLFITTQYLHGSTWMGGFISLVLFVGVVFFRIGHLVSNMSEK